MKHHVNTRGFVYGSLDRTSDANLVAKPREMGGIANCTLLHSINNFSFNALMSCSTESSRTESRDMVAATNAVAPRHSFSQTHSGAVDPASTHPFRISLSRLNFHPPTSEFEARVQPRKVDDINSGRQPMCASSTCIAPAHFGHNCIA